MIISSESHPLNTVGLVKMSGGPSDAEGICERRQGWCVCVLVC